ncbi:heat shock protein HtpX [Poriferisphaera corsica]|uniref:Heat shock protein HtpX n=1 Tax=Poriferisphaera corsica TaxID=2528020 RepID=A0A517YVF7_9BACT|nr:M48 family metallopeptidase [Poriferisphaera corsica]QDU34218.1 heat shock protein HtpX [Poriferisphaera corsica]
MMHVLMIVLVLLIFLNDSLEIPDSHSRWFVVLIWLISLSVLGFGYWLFCKIIHRRLKRHDSRLLGQLDRINMIFRLIGVGLACGVMLAGVLNFLRDLMGNVYFLPDALFLMPTICLFIWGWLCQYPIDQQLKEASLIRCVDDGDSVYEFPNRYHFLLNHLRHEMLIVLLPLLLILLWAETTEFTILPWIYGADWQEESQGVAWLLNDIAEVGSVITLTGGVVIFVLSPMIVRWAWDTEKLVDGTVRERILALCKTHQVNISEVLLWRTAGTMINAAVIGAVSKLRYILLSDALLDRMPTRELEAVMAHEIAHIRKKHILFLLIAAINLIGLLELLFNLIGEGIHQIIVRITGHTDIDVLELQLNDIIILFGLGATLIGWFILFGYVSRLAERQADTFGAVHMTRVLENDWEDENCVSRAGAGTMISALQLVADLNHIPTKKNNWRHGSIEKRQDYLRSIVGQQIDELIVDRQIRFLKYVCIFLLVLMSAGYWYLGG